MVLFGSAESPEGHGLKDWLQPMALLEVGGTFRRRDLVEESYVIGGVRSKEILGP
jgi:hypothetical protein